MSGDEGFTPSLAWHPNPGVPIIERLLTSLTVSDVFDELVIGWNGSRIADLNSLLARCAPEAKVFFRPWDRDFGGALNHMFERATGAFKFYFDTDDVVNWPLGEFKRFLRMLGRQHVIVSMPYHQDIDENGFIKMIVDLPRGGSGDLKFVGRMHAMLAGNGGTRHWHMPVKHYPINTEARSDRNLKVLRLEYEDQVKERGQADFRLLTDLGRATRGAEAARYNEMALGLAPTPEARFMVLRTIVRNEIANRNLAAAKKCVEKMQKILPRRCEPHFMLSICAYLEKDYQGCINQYWQGARADSSIMAAELAMDRTKAMLDAALSHIAMGEEAAAYALLGYLYKITKDPGVKSLQARLRAS